MAYLSSDYIKVYPSSMRGGTDNTEQTTQYDPESRLSTEKNLKSPISDLTTTGSFVIDDEISSSGELQFRLGGYYFKAKITNGGPSGILNLGTSFSTPNEIWASIKISQYQADQGWGFQFLDSFDGTSKILDEDDSFKGVAFTDKEQTGNEIYSLKILVKDGNKYVVPETSYLRYSSRMVGVGNAPLSNILKEEDGKINAYTDNVKNTDLITSENIKSNNIYGDNGIITKGVANKAVTITDSNGNVKTTGTTSKPVFLNNGLLQTISVLEVASGGTGQNDLDKVKVGESAQSDKSLKLTTENVGGHAVVEETALKDTTVYFKDGIPVAGMSLYISNEAPINSKGSNGDIWFKYN